MLFVLSQDLGNLGGRRFPEHDVTESPRDDEPHLPPALLLVPLESGLKLVIGRPAGRRKP